MLIRGLCAATVQQRVDHFSAIDGYLDVSSPLCAAVLRQIKVK